MVNDHFHSKKARWREAASRRDRPSGLQDYGAKHSPPESASGGPFGQTAVPVKGAQNGPFLVPSGLIFGLNLITDVTRRAVMLEE